MGEFDHYLRCLPQRPPSLFIDEVRELVHGDRVRGTVCFPEGHRIFENHLPEEPLVPGVILVEALAQIAGLVFATGGDSRIRGYLGEVSHVRFRRPVGPGSVVELEARLVRAFGDAARFEISASVDGKVVADGEITLSGRLEE